MEWTPGVIVGCVAIAAGLTAFAGRALLHRAILVGLAAPRVAHHATPADLGLVYTSVRIPTARARTLHAWYIAATTDDERPAPTVIVLHGWGGNAALMLPLAAPLHAAGFATLFIDARCHGASDGDSFASLPRFAEDVEHAFDWLAAQAGVDATRIALLGHSVGAGAVLLAATRRQGVAAVVCLAAFSHPEAMMHRWLTEKHIPERPLGRYILRFVERTIGHRFDDIAPLHTISCVRCPVLLVHGEDDRVVPIAEARQIYAARGNTQVELLALPGNHNSFADFSRNFDRLIAFLRAMPSRQREHA